MEIHVESKSACLASYECVTVGRGVRERTWLSQESGRRSTYSAPFRGRLEMQFTKEKFL